MCGSLPNSLPGPVSPTFGSPWFAIAVRTRWERSVERSVSRRGYESLVPVCVERRRWSDRWKDIETPLFPGYVFSRLDTQNRLPILTAPGVLYIVGNGKIPTPVDPEEIAAIQFVMRSGIAAKPVPYLQVGQPIVIGSGPLTGLKGIVLKLKSEAKLVLSVTLLRRSIAVEIDRASISVLTSAA